MPPPVTTVRTRLIRKTCSRVASGWRKRWYRSRTRVEVIPRWALLVVEMVAARAATRPKSATPAGRSRISRPYALMGLAPPRKSWRYTLPAYSPSRPKAPWTTMTTTTPPNQILPAGDKLGAGGRSAQPVVVAAPLNEHADHQRDGDNAGIAQTQPRKRPRGSWVNGAGDTNWA